MSNIEIRKISITDLDIYQPYIDGKKEIRQINAEYNAPFVRG